MNKIYEWATQIRDKYGGENPVQDEEILAGMILMIKTNFQEFRDQAEKETQTSKEFWSELKKFEEENEDTGS